MKVTLLAHTSVTPEAEEIMERQETSTDAEHLTTLAGRNCYESFHRPNTATADDRDYIKSTVLDKGHASVAEHSSATFLVENVSRNLTHELIRHRHLSFSQTSQRFCDESSREVVVPPALRDANPEFRDSTTSNEIDPDLLHNSREEYDSIVDYLNNYHDLGRKKAREAARYALLSGTSTSVVVTGNHRAWYEMLVKRLSPAADAEIQELAQELLVQLRELAPSLYQGLDNDSV